MDTALTRIGFLGTHERLARSTALREAIRRLGAAIAAGSDHPAFSTPDAASHLALTTRGEQCRFVDAGRCSKNR